MLRRILRTPARPFRTAIYLHRIAADAFRTAIY